MLALFGLLIVIGFMTLIMTKKATPFVSLVLVPLIIGLIAVGIHHWGFTALDIPKFAIAASVTSLALELDFGEALRKRNMVNDRCTTLASFIAQIDLRGNQKFETVFIDSAFVSYCKPHILRDGIHVI